MTNNISKSRSKTRVLLALSIALAACSPVSEGQARNSHTAPVHHALSNLLVIPLTTVHAGKRHTFRVEVAASEAEQEQGLMFRTAMGADEGMIFPMVPPRQAAFWMKNTVMPLDIIFIGADHRVLNIAANAVPYSLVPLPSRGVAAGVLELYAGRAKALGLVAGDRVEW